MPEKSRPDSNVDLGKPPIEYTRHFRAMLKERAIPMAYIKGTLAKPEKIEDRSDGTKHFLRQVPEHGNRWLRVVVNVSVMPGRAVTAFFDRRLRGK